MCTYIYIDRHGTYIWHSRPCICQPLVFLSGHSPTPWRVSATQKPQLTYVSPGQLCTSYRTLFEEIGKWKPCVRRNVTQWTAKYEPHAQEWTRQYKWRPSNRKHRKKPMRAADKSQETLLEPVLTSTKGKIFKLCRVRGNLMVWESLCLYGFGWVLRCVC